MEFRVLGELAVPRDGEPVDLGTFRQRALLALLLTAPNTVQSTDQLIDALWGEDSGIDRQNSLWVYVSGLRKALEPQRPKRTDGTILLTRSPGYLVQTDPDDIDAVRFERLVVEGRSLTETDPAAASLVLGEALALWRGRAYEDFTYESFAQPEIARLEELRLEAVQARIDADLRRGLSRELVSEPLPSSSRRRRSPSTRTRSWRCSTASRPSVRPQTWVSPPRTPSMPCTGRCRRKGSSTPSGQTHLSPSAAHPRDSPGCSSWRLPTWSSTPSPRPSAL